MTAPVLYEALLDSLASVPQASVEHLAVATGASERDVLRCLNKNSATFSRCAPVEGHTWAWRMTVVPVTKRKR